MNFENWWAGKHPAVIDEAGFTLLRSAWGDSAAAERKRIADELAVEITLDGFGCACEPRKQCGTCHARGVLEKALSPMVRRLRA